MAPESNRRVASRRVVVVPTHIDSAQRKERLGVTRDVSESGALLLSNGRYELGESLEVTFYVSADTREGRRARGRVVRVEPLQAGLQWRYALAIAFDSPLPDSEQIFAELEDES